MKAILVLLISFTAALSLGSNDASSTFQSEGSSSASVTQADLSRLYQIIIDPEVPPELKSAEVDSLFLKLDQSCYQGCSKAILLIENLNHALGSKPVRDFRSLLSALPEESPKKFPLLAIDELSRRVAKLSQFLDTTSEVNKARARASLGLLRYILSLKEHALFAIASKSDGHENEVLQLQTDIKKIGLQIHALRTIFTVLKARSQGDESGELTSEESKKIALAIRELGLFYSKFAQSLSNNSLLMGTKISARLKEFQDGLPPIPPKEVLATIERELGRSADQIFVEFDANTPVASATIAQTHYAKVRTWWGGTKEVAVKIQREGLEEELARNRVLNQILIKTSRVFVADPFLVPMIDFVASQVVGLENSVAEEMDFRIEIRNMERSLSLLRFVPSLRIAKPLKHLSTKRILVMDWLEGTNIDSLVKNKERPIPLARRKKLFAASLDALIYQVLVFGKLHGDMHPGNILGSEKGHFNIVDWSQVSNLRGLIFQPIRSTHYLITGQPDKFIRVFLKMGSAKTDFDKEGFKDMVRLQFRQSGFEPKTLKELLLADDPPDIDSIARVYGEIINTARKEFGFVLTPKYFQMGRTALPLIFTMGNLGEGIPKGELLDLLKWRLLMMAPKIPLQFLGGTMLHLFKRPFQRLIKTADHRGAEPKQVESKAHSWSCRRAAK